MLTLQCAAYGHRYELAQTVRLLGNRNMFVDFTHVNLSNIIHKVDQK